MLVLVIVLMAIVLATQTVIESDSENFVSSDSDDDYQSGENDDACDFDQSCLNSDPVVADLRQWAI
jgi:hypothetical protein